MRRSKNNGTFTRWNAMKQKVRRSSYPSDSMVGSREHYAKWNKLGGERQIPYDLIYKWNLINKATSMENITRDFVIKKKLTVTRVEVWGGNGGGGWKGEGLSGTCIKDIWAKPKRGMINGEKWAWLGWGRVVGRKWRQL